MPVCTAIDDFIKDQLRWVVELSNGDTVYQDDDRPDEDPPSAWLRLREHCHDNSLHIVGMRLQFRTHIVRVGPADEVPDAFYFARGAYGVMGIGEDPKYFGMYVAGHAKDDKVFITRWKTPELEELGREVRPYNPDIPSIIARKV